MHEAIEEDEAKPTDISDKEWDRMHKKAVFTIRQWVDESEYHHVRNDHHVRNESRADVLWRKLESIYEQWTVHDQVKMIRKLVNLQYKDGCSVMEHISDFQSMVNRLTAMKIALDDEVQAIWLFSSFPRSWAAHVVFE